MSELSKVIRTTTKWCCLCSKCFAIEDYVKIHIKSHGVVPRLLPGLGSKVGILPLPSIQDGDWPWSNQAYVCHGARCIWPGGSGLYYSTLSHTSMLGVAHVTGQVQGGEWWCKCFIVYKHYSLNYSRTAAVYWKLWKVQAAKAEQKVSE